MPLAALIGSAVGGPMLEYLGRRNTIITTAVPFIAAYLFIALANSSTFILIGRGLSGFCVGIASLSLPVYLGETVQPEVRGTLGLLPTAFGNIGILMAYAAGYGLNWSGLAYLGAALPIPFLVLMFLIPETPRWYVSQGKEPRARKALQWLRGRDADVEPELKGIMKSQAEAERHQSQNIARELLQRNNLKPLAISLGLMLFQQFSGINAVIFYAQSIFKESGSSMNDSEGTIIIGCVNFIATFVATLLIDRLGRKALLYISSVVMVISLALLGTFFYYKNTGADVSHLDVMPLICLMGYVMAFSLGFGPIPWLMMGEILPGKIRGSAASVATAFNWTCTFIVTKTFPVMLGKWYSGFVEYRNVILSYLSLSLSPYRRHQVSRHLLGLCCHCVRGAGLCDLLCAGDSGKDAGGYRTDYEWTGASNELGGQHEAPLIQHVNEALKDLMAKRKRQFA